MLFRLSVPWKYGLQALKGDDVMNAYRTLRISLAAAAVLLLFAEIGFTGQTYTVRRGDSLTSIAQRYGVSLTALKRANGLSTLVLNPGHKLTIPSNDRASSAPVIYGIADKNELNVEIGGRVAASLAKGSRFTVLAREGSKYSVKLDDGRTGWVTANDVTLDDTRKPTPMSDMWALRKMSMVQTALAFRGARYVSGGSGPYGFDCSGFVKYIYSKYGIKLPHDSRALFQCGTYVAKDALAPGDILFFVNTYRRGISHVGMYIGDGKFIHASTHRTGVKVSDLSESYYQAHYFAAKRVR